ncbi:MAG: DUF2442 domain-containing protein [Chlamydiae bacterium]|nr:DUF2442 domain-containing protein [Chlamydiota bacterium]
MPYRVKKVEYLSEYRLKIQFNVGKSKEVNLAGMLKNAKNMFLQLKDIEYFKKVTCDGYSICWPNGIDICPDLLYSMAKDISVPSKNRVQKTVKARKPKTRVKS